MYLSNIKISNFKTYEEVDVDFCSNVNCLVGNNGVGKTNLLDAIYYLSFCKSYFNPIDTQNISKNQKKKLKYIVKTIYFFNDKRYTKPLANI